MHAHMPPTGLLTPSGLGTAFTLERFAPAADLSGVVLRYWTVAWDVPTPTTYTQAVLPYPCVNVAVEPGRSGVFGVTTNRVHVPLTGTGWVFGIKFRPGAFYPLYRAPVAALTNRAVGVADIFGAAGTAYERRMLACTSVDEMISCAEEFVRAQGPSADPQVDRVNHVVDRIAADRTITRVAHVAARGGISVRTLQRVFHQYAGVSPKWVIRCYRLLEAADHLASRYRIDLPGLAQALGYYDQAHFINDFRAMVGSTPTEYARRSEGRDGPTQYTGNLCGKLFSNVERDGIEL